MAQKNKLAVLLPEKEIITAATTYTLRPFSFGQIPVVTQAMAEIMVDVARLKLEIDNVEDNAKAQQDLAALIFMHFDKVSHLISLCAGVPKEEIDALPIDDGIKMALETFEINKTFFIARVKPLIGDMMARIAQAATPTKATTGAK